MDEKEYDRQRVENLADTMGLQIEGNKITLNSSEKEIEDDIFRLIAGCYLIYTCIILWNCHNCSILSYLAVK